MSEPDDLDDVDEPDLDEPDDEAADDLTDEELAAALEWLHGPRNPLAGYDTPVTRLTRPPSTDCEEPRGQHDDQQEPDARGIPSRVRRAVGAPRPRQRT
ncbi:hypothetical protein [Streptomyces sp. NPDC058677]|uniref:hypothetical protein n=1 Tax=Streptomyces sp. NPDC058677 TaxID=3346594 RepID=UPI0036504777